MHPAAILAGAVGLLVVAASRSSAARPSTPPPTPPRCARWVTPAQSTIPRDVVVRAYALCGVEIAADGSHVSSPGTFEPNGYTEIVQSAGKVWRLTRTTHPPDSGNPRPHAGTDVAVCAATLDA